MGVYNGEKYVSRAIESILTQTYSDFEFIICNDCSKDNTNSILSKYSSIDDRIVILNNDENKGLSFCLNRGLSIAKGKYIARMDDDDISVNTRFETQLEFLENNNEYALVSSRRIFFDNNGEWGRDYSYGERSMIDVFKGKSFVHPSVIMKRDILNEIGGYSENKIAVRTEDYDLWCKFYYNGYKGFVLPDYLIKYYESRDSYSKRRYKFRINEFKLRLLWKNKLNLNIRYYFFAIRPLLVGLLPAAFMIKQKKRRYKNV